MRNENKKLYNASDLGQLDDRALEREYKSINMKVARGHAANKQRQINLQNIIALRKNSTSKMKDQFFKGSVEEINTVFWPFLFQSETVKVDAGQEVVSKITVTAEAQFVCTHMTRVIYEFIPGSGQLIYIDPDNPAQQASDLRYTLNDLSSERTFTDTAVSLDTMGNSSDPTKLRNPFMINSNQSYEFRFSSEGNRCYFASILFSGYRVRIEDARLLNLPTVTL